MASQTASFPLFPDFTHLTPFPSHPRSPSPLPSHKDDGSHTPAATGHPEHKKQPAYHAPYTIQQRYSAVRDALVEVVDQNGKSVIVARRHLSNKSQDSQDTGYDSALKFIFKLLKDEEGEEAVENFTKQHPKLRLQAWFDDQPVHNHLGFGHYVDIEPNSWTEVSSLADRIALVY